MRPADQTAAIARQLRIEDENLTKKIGKDAKRLKDMHLMLRKLHESSSNRTRALSPPRRIPEGRAITAARKKK
jgi:hypothetical protein